MWWLLATCCMFLPGPIYGHMQESITNPEANMNISEIISYWGYPYERHDVVTEDGYILGTYRIPHGKGCSRKAVPKAVVYLQHGLIASASNWICNLPNNSLAFLLADSGYDVWLGNSRGNTWSRKHLRLSPKSPEYWAFSLDEMAKYDLPATINLILEKSGQKQLFYVGHSQGTTIAFIAFSTNPELAKKIRMFFALAPVVTVKYTQSPMKKLTTLSRKAVKILFGDKMFSTHTWLEQFIATKVCNRKLFRQLCSNFLFSLSGFDPQNLNMSRLDVYMAQSPAGTSVQNMLHWAQAVNSGQLQAFDWGNPDQNMMHFNQLTPPVYNISKMRVPTAMWSGGRDVVADEKDTKNLLPKVANLIYYKEIPHYNHMDFYLGQDAPQEVYRDLITMMEESLQN
ncbi:lipase-like, ab-hydrolase domain containing 2 (predicted) [Rattus norvegicus]|uniref:Lipase n=2 Tax=Rattus norvegicus TaxID=10116 RepID=D4A9L7_RAT|nr:lipase member K precursor [Rattus norvegicus]EDM13151.1 lipase-like, ab-hydrolase domain containing 2 (predicted) [Rattus norvegicus]|eukprot:NP_001099844.1 lipase member K precursor [Rattus norvegicus]